MFLQQIGEQLGDTLDQRTRARSAAEQVGIDLCFQPRIAAEALIPWSALSLAKPPEDGKLKVEISSTAWHRSRWMSLSGLSPAEAANHPERWMQMQHGNHRSRRGKGKLNDEF